MTYLIYFKKLSTLAENAIMINEKKNIREAYLKGILNFFARPGLLAESHIPRTIGIPRIRKMVKSISSGLRFI
jgi:hypothetical protein